MRRLFGFRSGRFIPGEGSPGTHWIWSFVGHRAGLDKMEKCTFLQLTGLDLIFLHSPVHNQSLYRLRHAGSCRIGSKKLFGWSDLQTISKSARVQNETRDTQSSDLIGEYGCTNENHRKRLCTQALCNPGSTGRTVTRIKMGMESKVALNVVRNL
jgi:hypothetical protein